MILTAWPGMGRVPLSFVDAVVRGAQARGWDADGLLGHISSESGFDPAAKNPYASASGLIQVTDETARALGLRDAAQVRGMSPEEQLWKVVFPFFEMMGGGKAYTSGADYKIAGFGKRPSVPDSAVIVAPEHVGINPGFAVDPATGAVLAGAVRSWWRNWAARFSRSEFLSTGSLKSELSTRSTSKKGSGFGVALTVFAMAGGAAAAAWKATR